MGEFRGRILFVPGKNPKPDPMLHRALLWRVIQAGLAAHQPECARQLSSGTFQLAAWNREYYGKDKDATPDFEAIENLLAGRYEERRDRAEADNCWVKVQRSIRHLIDRYPFLMGMLADRKARDTIAETARYFDQGDAIGRRIREVVKIPLRQWLGERRPVLVIGHSLGSVIAWDALWELSHIDDLGGKLDFITMGSPLGMKFTRKRLLGSDRTGPARYPHLIGEWHNLAAVGDLISLDPTLSDDFAEMRKFGLVHTIEDHYQGLYTHYRDENGLNPHRSYGYLVHPVFAARIAAWWFRSNRR